MSKSAHHEKFHDGNSIMSYSPFVATTILSLCPFCRHQIPLFPLNDSSTISILSPIHWELSIGVTKSPILQPIASHYYFKGKFFECIKCYLLLWFSARSTKLDSDPRSLLYEYWFSDSYCHCLQKMSFKTPYVVSQEQQVTATKSPAPSTKPKKYNKLNPPELCGIG